MQIELRRVVVTGMGIVSPLGNGCSEVLDALQTGRSGISRSEQFAEKGFASQVWGLPPPVPEIPDRKLRRQMGQDSVWTYYAAQQAIAQAKLGPSEVSNDRTGAVIGTGGPSTKVVVEAADTNRSTGSPRRLGAFVVPQTMSSGAVANAAVAFGIRGANWSLTAACATSAHSIGNAVHLIQLGLQDIVLAGGAEALDWTSANAFDSAHTLSRKRNEDPTKASRPYDSDRDGFVIAGGSGIVVLESLESALRRGAHILAEIVGYGFSSDGVDMFRPSGEGAVRCMRIAVAGFDGKGIGPVDYINTHGTATAEGDPVEIEAVRTVFAGSTIPPISSTKSLGGHGLGAAGVWEFIHCMLMLENGFLAASANIENLDPRIGDAPIVRETMRGVNPKTVLSNSFGFGGTNATLIMRKFEG